MVRCQPWECPDVKTVQLSRDGGFVPFDMLDDIVNKTLSFTSPPFWQWDLVNSVWGEPDPEGVRHFSGCDRVLLMLKASARTAPDRGIGIGRFPLHLGHHLQALEQCWMMSLNKPVDLDYDVNEDYDSDNY